MKDAVRPAGRAAQDRRPSHVDSLDGLRFLAAAVVLFGHSWNCLAKPPEIDLAVREGPLTLLINGYGAVHLFFALSGFCLAGSAERVRGFTSLVQFWTRRVFRIHPPYVCALALAWLASFLHDTSQAGGGLSAEAVKMAAVHLSPGNLLPYFLYPGDAAMQLSPAWTLHVEMGFSLLLPAMVALAGRIGGAALVAIALVPLWWPGILPGLFSHAFHFALGIAIFLEHERLARWAARVPPAGHLALLLLALGVFASPWMLRVVFLPGFAHRPLGVLLSGTGAALLLGCALHGPATRGFLSSRPLVHGGRRSYSFYLLHYPVMLLMTQAIRGPVGWAGGAAFLAAVFVVTAAASVAGFRFVEVPAIRAGDAACRWLAGRSRSEAETSRLA